MGVSGVSSLILSEKNTRKEKSIKQKNKGKYVKIGKEPVKSFVGMFRKMKISLYDN